MALKTCKTCQIEQDTSKFHKHSQKRDGLSSYCKVCQLQKNLQWRTENRSVYLESKKKYNKNNIEYQKDYNKQYYQDNKIELDRINKEWVLRNPEGRKQIASKWSKRHGGKISAQRKAQKLNATPKWLTDDQLSEIDKIYKECQILTEKTGVRHEVDHIHPLISNIVCGLHVPWNLQILTKSENAGKGNKI